MKGKVKLALVVLAAALIVTAVVFVPVDRWVLALARWIRDAGPTGIVVYALAYVAATVLFLPGSLVTLAAGFAYGPVLGAAIVWPAATVGSTAAFLIGRFFARDWVAKRVASDSRFVAIERAVEREGLKIVFLLRLSPVFPFSLLNYALGLTSVRLRDYVLASVGMIPGTFLFVYLGSLVTSATELVGGERPDGGAAQSVLYWGGLGATLLVTVLITRIAQRALRENLAAGNEDDRVISTDGDE